MAKNKGLGRGLGGLISGGISTKQAAKTAAKTAEKKAEQKNAPKAPVRKKRSTPIVESPSVEAKSKKQVSRKAPKTESVVPAVIEGTRPFPEKKEVEDGARETAVGLYEIPTGKITPNPHQPRKSFDEVHLQELAESIRSEGLLQPIVVRKVEDVFELIAGERRWRACQMLKLKYIPARIMQASETSSAVLSLIENLQREDLNPMEESMGFASLLRDFDLTQEAVAERVGRSRASVANSLRLLQLPREVQGYISKRHLSVGHAKVLLGVEAEEHRLMLARQTIEKSWSVRELERQINLLKGRTGRTEKERVAPSSENTAIKDLERQMTSKLSTRVSLKHTPKRGKIIIEYHGNDDLQRIMDKLGLSS